MLPLAHRPNSIDTVAKKPFIGKFDILQRDQPNINCQSGMVKLLQQPASHHTLDPAVIQIRRYQRAIPHQKHITENPFYHLLLLIQHQPFLVLITLPFLTGQHLFQPI